MQLPTPKLCLMKFRDLCSSVSKAYRLDYNYDQHIKAADHVHRRNAPRLAKDDKSLVIGELAHIGTFT